MISALRHDPEVRANFYTAFDEAIAADQTTPVTASEIEKKLAKPLENASDTLPTDISDEGEWVTPEFRDLVLKTRNKMPASDRRSLNKKIKKLRLKLMNNYWETRANNINQAAENRKTEEVFRQAKRSDKPPRTDKPTCPVFKLEENFTNHLKEQPAPASDDLKDPAKIDKYLKNGRCVGVDGVAGEYLKYSESAEVTVLMISLFERIWEELECPETWMDNDAPQKQWLFSKTGHGQTDQWKLLGRDWNTEQGQIRRVVSNKKSLHELLNVAT